MIHTPRPLLSPSMRTLTLAIVCGLFLAACGASNTSSATSSVSSSPTKASPTAANSGNSQTSLTGMGATVAEMTAAHGVDVCNPADPSGSAPNTCFGAGFSNDESGKTYQFVNVDFVDGIVSGFQQNFPTDTTLSAAESSVLQWLPKDAVPGQVTVVQGSGGSSCGMLNIISPTIAKVFGSNPKTDDPSGTVGVEFEFTNANLVNVYDPSNIEDAQVQGGPEVPSAGC